MADHDVYDRLRTAGALEMLPPSVAADMAEDVIGRVFGAYRIRELIAEGGMSLVFRAERTDGRFERDVAIKVSTAGGLRGEARERFLREQGMLAGLTHPGISQLYDAQVTPEGLPYIVMEMIRGVPADAYCREHDLEPRAVVALMIQIVEALAFAHARLIVHRDIKPSDVLVDSDGKAKVLDFGIAKLLETESATATQSMLLTPRFASPEQLLGQQITIASDIFQLGLLFYHLLTGRALREGEGLSAAISGAAGGRPVVLPREVRAGLPRELALIIEQCLRPQPEERYADANALRQDLQAYLAGYPVSAAGQGAAYRLRKFVGRNAAATAIATLSAVAVLTGSIWYAYSLGEARQLAEERAATSSRVLQAMSQLVATTFAELLEANGERQTGSAAYVSSVLRDTVALVERELATESAAQAELLRVQGTIEMVLGDTPGASATLASAHALVDASERPELAAQILLDRVEAASRSAQPGHARALLQQSEQLLADTGVDPPLLALYHIRAGEVMQLDNEHLAAVEQFQAAIELLQEAPVLDYRLLAKSHYEIAFTLSNANEHEQAIAAAERAIEVLEGNQGPMSYHLVRPLREIAWSRIKLDETAAAKVALDRALDIATANFGDIHPHLAALHDTLGALAYQELRFQDAVDHFETHMEIVRELEGEASRNLHVPLVNAATILTDLGDMEQAGRYFQQVERMLEPGDPADRRIRSVIAYNDGRRLVALGDYEAAVARYRQTLEIDRELLDPDNFQLVSRQRDLAIALHKAGRLEEARRHFEASLQRYGELRGTDSDGYAAWALQSWRFDLSQGDLEAARSKLYRTALKRVEDDHLETIFWTEMLADLATVCLAQQDLSCARQALDWAGIGTATAPEHPWSYYVQVVEAEYWRKAGDNDRARALARTAHQAMVERFPLHAERIARAEAVIVGRDEPISAATPAPGT